MIAAINILHFAPIAIPPQPTYPGTLAHFNHWADEYRRKRRYTQLKKAAKAGRMAMLVYSHAGAVVFGLSAGVVFGRVF